MATQKQEHTRNDVMLGVCCIQEYLGQQLNQSDLTWLIQEHPTHHEFIAQRFYLSQENASNLVQSCLADATDSNWNTIKSLIQRQFLNHEDIQAIKQHLPLESNALYWHMQENLQEHEFLANTGIPELLVQATYDEAKARSTLSDYVLAAILRHQQCPVTILEAHGLDEDRHVQYSIACNARTPNHILMHLADKGDNAVQARVASRTDTPVNAFHRLWNHGEGVHHDVELALARNHCAPVEILRGIRDQRVLGHVAQETLTDLGY